ncbi:PIG-L family deacetylase [Actinotalea sp. AC32]|nr:PIG-L family deacetylase [Actinotalea sp. AC32]
MTTGGLLAVHAHPDDETLSTGALLATWARAGRPVTVVTCTRGEQGEVIPPALRHLEGAGAALAEHREGELARALAALGVADYVFLDRVAPATRYADSGMAWAGGAQATRAAVLPDDAFVAADLDGAARRLADVVAERRPAVVVGYEPGGGYGHPDHVRAHEVMHRAVELARSRWDVPVVLWGAVPADAWGRGVDDLRRAGVPTGLTLPGERPSAVVDAVDVEVDVVPVLDRVLHALAAHATQVHAVARVEGATDAVARLALSNDVAQPVLRSEGYRVARGAAEDVAWPDGVRALA